MSDQLFKRSDDALFSEVGDDIVALHVQRGQCYGMEKVTAAVWAMLAEPISIPAMCERLVDLYDVEPSVCRAEVGKLIVLLEAEGLIDRVAARAA